MVNTRHCQCRETSPILVFCSKYGDMGKWSSRHPLKVKSRVQFSLSLPNYDCEARRIGYDPHKVRFVGSNPTAVTKYMKITYTDCGCDATERKISETCDLHDIMVEFEPEQEGIVVNLDDGSTWGHSPEMFKERGKDFTYKEWFEQLELLGYS